MWWKQSTCHPSQMIPAAVCTKRLGWYCQWPLDWNVSALTHVEWLQTPQIFTSLPWSTWGHMILDSWTDVTPVRGNNIILCLTVYNCFDAAFSEHWIGWGGPFSWPLQQPDLTPFDFSLWGQVKTVLYNSPTETAEELIAMIVGAFQVVQTTPGLFTRVHQSMLHDVACAMCLGGGVAFQTSFVKTLLILAADLWHYFLGSTMLSALIFILFLLISFLNMITLMRTERYYQWKEE